MNLFQADVAQLVEHSLGKRCGSESVAATNKGAVTPVTSAENKIVVPS
jgi:hypothetical protein